ncbi:Kae1-associated serine/threonine protein kinase [Candidatus Woesearchaeota archaeon]|nr:Kae1-associated serine/threonine protein kinase [Candidatus Woesearchaeota archaeon]
MLISQGAEARLYKEGTLLIKDRIRKNYRHSSIDSYLRKSRTRREALVLEKASKLGIPVPALRHSDGISILKEDFIEGGKLSDVIEKINYADVAFRLGSIISKLHSNNIIHGDLTTSNIIVSGKELFLIDFGLSFFSRRIEDKVVDVNLFRQALEARHPSIWEDCFSSFIKGYLGKNDSKEFLSRLDVVSSRGRNKRKV